MRYVSTHPMFGPTFGNIKELSGQNAIIISESDAEGKEFFKDFYRSLQLKIFEYSFVEHDQVIAIPYRFLSVQLLFFQLA